MQLSIIKVDLLQLPRKVICTLQMSHKNNLKRESPIA